MFTFLVAKEKFDNAEADYIYICRMLYLFCSFLFDKRYSSIRKHWTFLRCVFLVPGLV